MQSAYVPSTELLEEFLRGLSSTDAARPSLEELQALVDVTFWASLRTEEGRSLRPALSLTPPELSPAESPFRESVALTVDNLAKLAPVLGYSEVHAGVWRGEGGHRLWGLVLAPAEGALRIRATSPGVLHLSAGRDLVATLSDKRVQLVAPGQAYQFNELLTRALGLTADDWLRSRQADYLRHIARRIREHGRGGTVVIVPAPEGSWTLSLRLRHRFVSPLQDIVHAWRDETAAQLRQTAVSGLGPASASAASLEERASALVAASVARTRARTLSDRIGDVTTMDGAAVVTRELALLGFGAKMATDATPPRIVEIRPVVGAAFEPRSLDALGGMRHQSAARFVTAQRDCVVLVVSQDGMVSLFSWLSSEDAVLVAREVELLLWSD